MQSPAAGEAPREYRPPGDRGQPDDELDDESLSVAAM